MEAPSVSVVLGELKKKPGGPKAEELLRHRMRYQLAGEDRMVERIRENIERFKRIFSGTVLDVGCYTGYLYHALGKPDGYTGLDNWPEAIKVAKEFAPEANFICADVTTDELGSYDYVWCSQTIENGGLSIEFVEKVRKAARIKCFIVQSKSIDDCIS